MTADTLRLLLPEIILVLAGFLVIIIDLALRRRTDDRLLAGVAVVGLLLAAVAAFTLRGSNPQPVLDMLAVDGFSTFLMVAVLVGIALVVLYSMDYMKGHSRNRGEYYAFLLAVALAIVLAVSANDLLMVYLAMEFLSITSYILVGYLRDDLKSSEAAIKYFLYGSVASGVMLYGISMIFGATGTTNLSAVAMALTGQGLEGGMRWLALTSVILLVVGFLSLIHI